MGVSQVAAIITHASVRTATLTDAARTAPCATRTFGSTLQVETKEARPWEEIPQLLTLELRAYLIEIESGIPPAC